jgi:hypothetical protein
MKIAVRRVKCCIEFLTRDTCDELEDVTTVHPAKELDTI